MQGTLGDPLDERPRNPALDAIDGDGIARHRGPLTYENQVVCVESLAVKSLIRNRSQSKAIADAGWGKLVRQLEYKAAWTGRQLVKIDRWFPSSKRCSCCGHTLASLPLRVRD